MASKKKSKGTTKTKTSASGDIACKRKADGNTCGALNPAGAAFCHHCKGDPTKAIEQ